MTTEPSAAITAPTKFRQTALLSSPVFAGHDSAHHPENQVRLAVTGQYLRESGLLAGRPPVDFGEAPLATIEAVHNATYVEQLNRLAMSGGAWLDQDTYIGPRSYEVALHAAGAVVAAVDAALEGVASTSLALVRPPGHHATPERGMGFCLLNNVAIGAARALERGLQRVAIVDWDVHHGNGTQDAFYSSGQVLYCSVHQFPFYPGTGESDERGEGKGEGFTINVPIRAGQGDATYLDIIDRLFLPGIRQFQPELLLVSAGYDCHANDPIGGMRVTERGFAGMTRRLLDVADSAAGGRLVAVLEGGYNPEALAHGVAATLRTLDDEDNSAV